jgi:uncharacterized surface protein with fasciclin (FAS1) repeats
LTTLVAAIDAAGMKHTFDNAHLKGTVFAPTNDAFAELIAALNTTPEDLLGNKALLRKVLKYHVVGGKPIKSSDIPNKLTQIYTWDGLPLGAKTTGGGVNIYYGKGLDSVAKVVKADVKADRTIVHVINKVRFLSMNE